MTNRIKKFFDGDARDRMGADRRDTDAPTAGLGGTSLSPEEKAELEELRRERDDNEASESWKNQ